MEFVVMERAERHGELVADFQREAALLTEGEVMRLRGLSAADDTRVRRDEHQMRFVSKAALGADRKKALINPGASRDF